MHCYDYALVRVVPRVERGEFINAGVIVSCACCGFLGFRMALDEGALLALAPQLDVRPIRKALQGIDNSCAGAGPNRALTAMTPRERFHWLVAPRSTSIQVSAVHSGRCHDPQRALDALLDKMVRRR